MPGLQELLAAHVSRVVHVEHGARGDVSVNTASAAQGLRTACSRGSFAISLGGNRFVPLARGRTLDASDEGYGHQMFFSRISLAKNKIK